ncbi:protein NPG1 [Gossypium raimondii]|nr:protein NPG1 [Gossypium raimondii]
MADDETPSQTQESSTAREFSANGTSMSTTDVEAKLDKGNIEEAESSLRERLPLNSESASCNPKTATFRNEHLNPNSSSVSSSNYSSSHENNCANLDSQSQQAARLVLEGVYLKVKSLQKLGKFAEAAQDCTNILDAVGRIFPQGIPDAQVESKLQEMISKAVELLPELLKQAGKYQEAMAAYRRVLLNPWNLDNDCCGRIQKAFAVFLLHSGLEAGPPSLGAQADGAYVPKNNLEEAIPLLLVLMRKIHHGDIQWDPSVLDHLMYALSLCSQTPVLSNQLEELKPGVFHRTERWNLLALCCSGVGQNKAAMNLLRKSLHINERPNDLTALLLAAKICSEDSQLAAEGVGYAQRAVDNAKRVDEHLNVGLRMLGLCLGKQAKVSSSDFERSRLQNEALKSLDSALSFEQDNPDIIFELGAHYAEQRNLNAALRFAKKYIDITGGSVMKGWRLLALILSAQQRFAEAEVVTDAALDETGKWEQGPLLRLKAKLKVSQSRPMEAIETYCYLLALVQAQRKSSGPMKIDSQVEDDKVKEFEVWYGLAALYSSLSHWKDVEVCVKKAREMKQYSAELVHTEGFMHQERGEIQEALASYINASLLDPFYVPSKVRIGALLSKLGSNSLPVARTLLSDALRIEPTNRKAWYHLGMVHKDDGRLADAIDFLQAASMLEESDPVENFRSIL